MLLSSGFGQNNHIDFPDGIGAETGNSMSSFLHQISSRLTDHLNRILRNSMKDGKGQGHQPAVRCHIVHDISPLLPFSIGLISPGLCPIHFGYTVICNGIPYVYLSTGKT